MQAWRTQLAFEADRRLGDRNGWWQLGFVLDGSAVLKHACHIVDFIVFK